MLADVQESCVFSKAECGDIYDCDPGLLNMFPNLYYQFLKSIASFGYKLFLEVPGSRWRKRDGKHERKLKLCKDFLHVVISLVSSSMNLNN